MLGYHYRGYTCWRCTETTYLKSIVANVGVDCYCSYVVRDNGVYLTMYEAGAHSAPKARDETGMFVWSADLSDGQLKTHTLFFPFLAFILLSGYAYESSASKIIMRHIL